MRFSVCARVRESEHDRIFGAALPLLDPQDIMPALAQRRDHGTGHVLVGEEPHVAVQRLTANIRSAPTTSQA